jgi:hypothetical protein
MDQWVAWMAAKRLELGMVGQVAGLGARGHAHGPDHGAAGHAHGAGGTHGHDR